MAYDYTFSSGKKTSRIRRNASGPISTGQSTVKRQDFGRETPDIQPPVALEGLTGAIGDFFGKSSTSSQKEEIDARKESNARAISEMKAKIAMDPEGAREAMETKDFSKFVANDEDRAQSVVQQEFSRLAGARAGLEDYESDYRHAIMQTPMTGNPRDSLSEALSTNLSGAGPTYAEAYSNTVLKAGEPVIAAWNEKRRVYMILKAESQAMAVTDKAIDAGQITTMDEYRSMSASAGLGIPGIPFIMQQKKGEEIVELAMLRKAVQAGGEDMMALLTTKDPARDGTTILERRKEDYLALLQKSRAAETTLQTAKALSDHDNLSLRIEAAEGGLEGSDSYGDLTLAYQGFLSKHGKGTQHGPRMTKLRKRLIELANVNIEFRTVAANVVAGSTPWNSAKAQGVFEKSLLDGSLVAEVMKRDKSDQKTAIGKVVELVGRMGINAKTKENLSRQLTSKDPAQRQQAFSLLASINNVAQLPIRDFFPKGVQGTNFNALYTRAIRRPEESGTVLADWADNNEGMASEFASTTFISRMKDPDTGERMTDTTQNIYAKILDKMGNPTLSPRAQSDLRQRINVTASVFQHKKFDENSIVEDLVSNFENAYSPRVTNAANDTVLSLRGNSLKLQKNPVTGLMEVSPPPSIEEMKFLTTAIPQIMSDSFGGDAYVSVDQWTQRGGGFAVKDRFGSSITLKPGDNLPVSAKMRQDMGAWTAGLWGDADMFDAPFSEGEPGEILMIPGAPKPGESKQIQVNDNVSLVYNQGRGVWMLRARMVPTDRTDAEQQEGVRLAARKIAKELAVGTKAGESVGIGAVGEEDSAAFHASREGMAAQKLSATLNDAPDTTPEPKIKPSVGKRVIEELISNGVELPEDVRQVLSGETPVDLEGRTEEEMMFKMQQIISEIADELPAPERHRWDVSDPNTDIEPVTKPVENHTVLNEELEELRNGAVADGTIGVEDIDEAAKSTPSAQLAPGRSDSADDDMDAQVLFLQGEDFFQSMNEVNNGAGQYTESANMLAELKATARMQKHMVTWEKNVSYLYDDAAGGSNPSPWHTSKKTGNPTIGIGFNIGKTPNKAKRPKSFKAETARRAYAKKMIEEVGGDFDKILAGTESLGPEKVQKLYEITLRDVRKSVLKKIGKKAMGTLAEHQVMALISLVYNGGPKMIGKIIKTAIKNKQWKIVENDIRHHNLPKAKMIASGRSNQIEGLKRRRWSEADLWGDTILERGSN